MTANSSQRAHEISIRKTVGARRADLIAQFLVESLLYSFAAMMLALSFVEWALPPIRAFTGADLVFPYWQDPKLLGAVMAATLIFGLLAGAYPAFFLSALRPSRMVRGLKMGWVNPRRTRNILVAVQFATLIGLLLVTGVIFLQTQFATNAGVILDEKQVYLINAECKGAFKDRLTALPGVVSTACSSPLALGFGKVGNTVSPTGGQAISADINPVDFGFFEFYGLRPMSGRFFSAQRAGDAVVADTNGTMEAPVVINETALRRLNLGSADDAVGKTLSVSGVRKMERPSTIIGVVRDFSVDTIHTERSPAIYVLDQTQTGILSVRLSERFAVATLAAIDRLWAQTGATRPISRTSLQTYAEQLYSDVVRQGSIFAAFSAVALFIACLGLVGLAALTAERRIKEIGIRKCMGAGIAAILGLLTWEFAKPVLWAKIIAWPAAFYFTNRWLSGFAHHIDLQVWMFFAAGTLALLIALVTVLAQSVSLARAKPVASLRYE